MFGSFSASLVSAGIREVLAHFGTSFSTAHASQSVHYADAQTQPTYSSATSNMSLKSIREMTSGPLADGRVTRLQQDVVRLLTWLLRKDMIVPVFEHYYLCIPSRLTAVNEIVSTWATSEEEDSPRTPRVHGGLGSETDSSIASGSSMKSEKEMPNAEASTSGGATGDHDATSKCGSDGEATSTVYMSAQSNDGENKSDRQVTGLDLHSASPHTRIAQAAGLSDEELAQLQSLQRLAPENDGALGISRTRSISDEELQVFLGWCPVLRGGCRFTELMKATGSASSENGADSGRNSGGAAPSGSGAGMVHRKHFVEDILNKYSPCLVKIVHEAHEQPQPG